MPSSRKPSESELFFPEGKICSEYSVIGFVCKPYMLEGLSESYRQYPQTSGELELIFPQMSHPQVALKMGHPEIPLKIGSWLILIFKSHQNCDGLVDWWTPQRFTDAQLRFRRPAAGWCVANPLPWLVQDWWAHDLYCQRALTWEHGDCRTQRWKSKKDVFFFLGRIFSQSHRLGSFYVTLFQVFSQILAKCLALCSKKRRRVGIWGVPLLPKTLAATQTST